MHDFGHRTKAYLTAKVKKQPEERELLAELEDGLPEFKAAVETGKSPHMMVICI